MSMPGETRFRQLMDTAPVLIWCADAERRCIYVNKVWLDFTGREMEQEFGCGWATGVHPEDFERISPQYSEFFEKQAPFRLEFRLRRHDGVWRWLLGTAVPRHSGAEGAFGGFIGSCVDISEIKEAEQIRQRALEEKAALLQELHHRVKNNAQVFASLLTIQANRSKNPDVEAALRTAASRAAAIAVAQQQIHDSPSLAEFDLVSFVRRLLPGIGASKQIEIEVTASKPVPVPLSRAVPLSLIVHELLTNAARHGFPGGRTGQILISFERDPQGRLCFAVTDDGIGLAPGVTLEGQRSAGLTIVKSLARQLGADLTMSAERGTQVCLLLPP